MSAMTDRNGRRVIELRLGRARAWRWQFELARRLSADPGVDLVVRFVDGPALPVAFDMLCAVEGSVLGLSGERACDRLDAAAFARWMQDEPVDADLVLDFSPAASDRDSPPDLRVLYDGSPDEDSMLTSVLMQRATALSIIDRAGHAVASAYPGIEDYRAMTRALDHVFTALLRLVLKAVRQPRGQARPAPAPRPERRALTSGAILSFGARALAGKLRDRLDELCREGPSWFVAWRKVDRASCLSGLMAGLKPDDYTRMANEPGRYYADPFLFEAEGRMHVFVEEFPYATGKGLISVATLTADGVSRPRPVLETASHSSYPHVFAHEGNIWMIPESAQARSVDLYRAERFPDRWVHEARLLDGIEAGDATLCRREGLWWMFVATREWHGSSWDGLCVFFAERLKGPWLAHPDNPILIDSRSARPAGQFFLHQGELWRPAQDCSENYGTGLSFCRIERLDRGGVAQAVTAHIRLRGEGVTRGPHTFNRLGGVEVIDLFGVGGPRPD